MRDADAFAGTKFLGLARRGTQDAYRLALFAQHLEPDERPLCFLPIQGGTLVATDRRAIVFRPHLDPHGAWNVKEFLGFEIHRAWARGDILGLERREGDPATARPHEVRLVLRTKDGPEEIRVSRGQGAVLPPEDLEALRAALLAPHA